MLLCYLVKGVLFAFLWESWEETIKAPGFRQFVGMWMQAQGWVRVFGRARLRFLPPFYKGRSGHKVKARGDLFCVVRIFTKCKGSK